MWRQPRLIKQSRTRVMTHTHTHTHTHSHTHQSISIPVLLLLLEAMVPLCISEQYQMAVSQSFCEQFYAFTQSQEQAVVTVRMKGGWLSC